MKSLYARSPLWLEYSGLPELLTQKAGPAGWPLFKKLVEIDCEKNPMSPGTFEVSLDDLARATGHTTDKLKTTVNKLRKLKLIRCFIPDTSEEPGLFEIRTPLKAPLTPAEIRSEYKAVFRSGYGFFRYIDQLKDIDPDDPVLGEVAQLYFKCIGTNVNSLVLDQLRLLRERFSLGRIQKVMEDARKVDVHSLSWVVRHLYKEESKESKKRKTKKKD